MDIGEKIHEYYPRRIAIAKRGGARAYEFLIIVDDRGGALAHVFAVFAKHKADVRNVYSHSEKKTNSFVLALCVDMTKADLSADGLASELNRHSLVRRVDFVKMGNRVYDQFLYPISILEDHRALVIRVEALINIEKGLTQTYGSAGAAITFEEGKAFAMESFRMVKEALPRLGAQLTVENMIDGFRAQGWGLFEIERAPQGAEVRVENPPVLKDGEPRPSSFFLGICAGAVEEVFNLKVKITGSRYDRATDVLTVTLHSVQRQRPPRSTVQPARQAKSWTSASSRS